MGLPQQHMTLQDYLEWENVQIERHEFYRGEIFAMTGGRRSHGRVTANLVMLLGIQLKGTPCQVFSESMKVQIAEDTVLYPDIFVTCDRQDLQAEMIFRAPTLIVEVLSPSTQALQFDSRSDSFALALAGGGKMERGNGHGELHSLGRFSPCPLDSSQKFALYRRLHSLREYALIDPETRRVEVFRINAEGLFVLFDMTESEMLELASINCKVAIAEVFAGIDFGS